MGLTTAEFYALTPRQLNALLQAKQNGELPLEFLLAQLTSYVVNFSQHAPKKPTKPAEFMPSEWRKRAQKTDEQAEADELRAFVARHNARFARGK